MKVACDLPSSLSAQRTLLNDVHTLPVDQVRTAFARMLIGTVAVQHPTTSLDVTPDQNTRNGPDQPGYPSEDLTIPVMKEG